MALALLRQHRRWFYVFLWVVILSFVILYIPSFDPQQQQLADDTLATVGGQTIRTREFQAAYVDQIRRFQQMSQGRLDDAMIERLGIREQVLSSLASQKIIGLEATRLGIKVDDDAVARAITEDPNLQVNGAFVGADRLRSFLQSQGKTLRDFEEDVRRQLQAERFQRLVTDGVQVAGAEIEAEFRKRTDLARAEYVHVMTASYEGESAATDAEAQARFEANKEAYRLPERRRVSYILVDPAPLRAKTVVQGSEIEAYYRNRASEFQTPEQVCGRHILLKVRGEGGAEGRPEAEAKSLADKALARVQRGEAFEAVAKAVSEDTSASSGGSLGCFPRGQMVPEFEAAAFALAAGATSDLVRSPFGFHIIRVDSRVAPGVIPIEQARARIQAILQDTKSRQAASTQTEAILTALNAGRTIEQAAAEQSLAVQKSEPLAPGRGAAPLFDPGLLAKTFELQAGQTAKEAFPAGAGAAFIRVDEILPSNIPDFAEVKEDARRDASRTKARERARALAQRVADQARTVGLDRAARAEKLTRKQTDGLLGRGQVFTDIPSAEAFESRAFALDVNAVSDPIETPAGFAVVRLIEKKTSDRAALEVQRETLRESIAATRRQQLFESYMRTLADRYPVERNAAAIARLR
jgi:peptidyl-prolyl cis-trans isomerase D